MDMQSPTTLPDPGHAGPPPPTTPIFHKRLMQALAATMPGDTPLHSEAWAENWDTTRELYESLAPRDPAEAALAAFAVAALQGAMDNFARAARPGVSDEKAGRLRGGALAAGRAYAATMRQLRKAQPAAEPAPAEKPSRSSKQVAPPAPAVEPIFKPNAPPYQNPNYTPRDKYGQPIAFWRDDAMTMAQRRATYGETDDFAAQAIARAEEDKAIEEERQRAAAEPPPPPPD